MISKTKRFVEIVVGVTALIIALPILIILAVLILITAGRPVLFRQVRAGFHGRPFTCFKFRTMTNAADSGGASLPDALRLTTYGRILRSSSLDELPQLWNVIRGDMSLVGPRPLPLEYLPRYNPHQRRRHEVKPGITGWAQVNGRNGLSWEEKFNLDVWYVEHRSLWLDIKILSRTLLKVFKSEDISQPGHATMPEFTTER